VVTLQDATKLIQQASFALRTTRQATYQAQVNLHRFYETHSSEEYPLIYMCMASLFTSLKLCDSERRNNEVLASFDRALKVDQDVDRADLPELNSSRMSVWRRELRASEAALLRALGFDLFVIHPASYLEPYLDALDLPLVLAQSAFAFLSDVGHSPACIRYHPVILCLAAITAAAHAHAFNLPLPLLAGVDDNVPIYNWPEELLPTGPVHTEDSDKINDTTEPYYRQKRIAQAAQSLLSLHELGNLAKDSANLTTRESKRWELTHEHDITKLVFTNITKADELYNKVE